MRNRKPHMNNICFEIDRFLQQKYEYIGIFIQFCVLYQELCESFGYFGFEGILGVPIFQLKNTHLSLSLGIIVNSIYVLSINKYIKVICIKDQVPSCCSCRFDFD